MPFFNQPLTLEIPARLEALGNVPLQFGDAAIAVRYAHEEGKPPAQLPEITKVQRAGSGPRRSVRFPKSTFVLVPLECDVHDKRKGRTKGKKRSGSGDRAQIYAVGFRGDRLTKRLSRGGSRADQWLYDAILDRAVLELVLDLGKSHGNGTRRAKRGPHETVLRLKLELKFT